MIEQFLSSIRRESPGVSLGTATQSSQRASVADLYARADAALYESRGQRLRTDTD